MTAEMLALTFSHPESLCATAMLTQALAMRCWSSWLAVAHMSMKLEMSLTQGFDRRYGLETQPRRSDTATAVTSWC